MNKLAKKDNWFCSCYWDSLRKGSELKCNECDMRKSDISGRIAKALDERRGQPKTPPVKKVKIKKKKDKAIRQPYYLKEKRKFSSYKEYLINYKERLNEYMESL